MDAKLYTKLARAEIFIQEAILNKAIELDLKDIELAYVINKVASTIIKLELREKVVNDGCRETG